VAQQLQLVFVEDAPDRQPKRGLAGQRDSQLDDQVHMLDAEHTLAVIEPLAAQPQSRQRLFRAPSAPDDLPRR
jgi:hypothetical protein